MDTLKAADISNFIPVLRPLRIYHYPQIGMEPYYQEVKDEKEALRIINILADHHLYLFNHNVIYDYTNIFGVEMYDSYDVEELVWGDYYNEVMDIDWKEVEEILG